MKLNLKIIGILLLISLLLNFYCLHRLLLYIKTLNSLNEIVNRGNYDIVKQQYLTLNYLDAQKSNELRNKLVISLKKEIGFKDTGESTENEKFKEELQKYFVENK